MIVFCAILFTACTPHATETHPEYTPQPIDIKEDTTSEVIPDYFSSPNHAIYFDCEQSTFQLSNEFISENGVYRLKISDVDFTENETVIIIDGDTESGLILSVSNSLWSDSQPLCNRIECMHDNSECAAYFPSDWFRERGCLFVSGEDLYVFIDNTLYRMDLMGQNRQTIMSLPDKYDTLLGVFYYNNKLYFMASRWEHCETLNHSVNYQDFIELDYNAGTERVIRTRSVVDNQISALDWHHGRIIGFYDGRAYYLLSGGGEHLPPPLTQATYDAMRNSVAVHLYSISLTNGNTRDIFNGVLYDNDLIAMDSNRLFWHSRRESALKTMNLSTHEITTLVENVTMDTYAFRLLDGRLIYNVSNTTIDDGVNDNFKPPSMFWVDLSSGTTGEITFRAESDGQSFPITEIRYWGENFLFVVSTTTTGRNSEKQWATISRTDFWNDDFSNIQIMG